jgi:hypothetical protein
MTQMNKHKLKMSAYHKTQETKNERFFIVLFIFLHNCTMQSDRCLLNKERKKAFLIVQLRLATLAYGRTCVADAKLSREKRQAQGCQISKNSLQGCAGVLKGDVETKGKSQKIKSQIKTIIDPAILGCRVLSVDWSQQQTFCLSGVI